MSGSIIGCHSLGGVERYWHLWKRPRMLLNIPKRTGEPLAMKNYLSQKSAVPRFGNPILGESLLSTTTTVCTTNSVLAFIIFLKIFIYLCLWPCWVCVAVHRLSPVMAGRATLAAVCWAVHSVASLAAEHGSRRPGFRSCGSQAQWRGASRCGAWGASRHVGFSDRGSNLCPLYWQAGFLLLNHQRSSFMYFAGIFLWRNFLASMWCPVDLGGKDKCI